METIQQQLLQATQQLTESDSPRLDAEVLLSHIIEKDRSYFLAWPEKALADTQIQQYKSLIEQRKNGTPIAHLTGYRDFWTLTLKVTPDTLIPRPETELLVETALEKIPADAKLTILDLGTGTGAIALAIASERPKAQVTATDFSSKALAVAQENAENHHIQNVTFLQSNWFSQLPPQQFDLILSNPPYIPQHDKHLSQGDVRFEPDTALVSGDDGLDDIRKIAQTAKSFLTKNGWLILEHGYDQKEAVLTILKQNHYQKKQCLLDFAGNPRISFGQS
jgi:release factor glutamine methyltransferase